MHMPIAPPGYVQVTPGTHRPGSALFWGFLLTGGGQFCNRQPGKGALALVFAVCLFVPTVGIGTAFIWVLAMIDAYKIAERLDRGEMVALWQFF